MTQKTKMYRITHTTIIFVLLLLMLTTVFTRAAPSYNSKPTYSTNSLNSFIISTCTDSGRCWSWLPILNLQDENYVLQEPDALKIQTAQPVGMSMDLISSKDTSFTQKTSSVVIPSNTENRLEKKNIFLSHGWGAGGMPFSVLYLNPHNSRINHSVGTRQADLRKTLEETNESLSEGTSSLRQSNDPNYRVALRNGAFGQSRRQYSIIPQLFISYGWGPSGK